MEKIRRQNSNRSLKIEINKINGELKRTMIQETSDDTFLVKDKTCRNEQFHWREGPILHNLDVTRF